MPSTSGQLQSTGVFTGMIGGASREPAEVQNRMPAHILVVDDEPDISALVAYHLARESYRVRTASSGPEAIRAAEVERPDLIVLDLMLPGMSGLAVLEELRRRPETLDIPVILLTARKEEQDRIAGLRLGADDYVAKPFSPAELAARISSVLRRTRSSRPAPRLEFDGLALDLSTRDLTVDGKPVEVTPREFDLLAFLAASPPAGLLPGADPRPGVGLVVGVAGRGHRHRARPSYPPPDRGRPRQPPLDQDRPRCRLPLRALTPVERPQPSTRFLPAAFAR